MPSGLYSSEVENFRGLLSDVGGKKTLANKDHRIQMQIVFERLLGETWHIDEKSGRQRKIWITALKFDEFCNRKFNKRSIPFRACLHWGGGPQVIEVTRLVVVEK